MEEKKTYDLTYVVTISTEEYRELIDERATFKCEADNYRSDYYKAISEVKAKDIEIKKLNDIIDQFRAFVSDSAALEDSYRNFCRDIGEAADA